MLLFHPYSRISSGLSTLDILSIIAIEVLTIFIDADTED